MTEGKMAGGVSGAGATANDKDALVEQIVETEAWLQRGFLAQRTNPLLDLDLTMQQLKALLLLSFNGSASGHELAEVLGVHLASATGIVDRLAGRGLVVRGEDPNDRRIRRVFVTKEGSELAERVWSAGLEERRKVLEKLEVGDLRKLKEITEILAVAAAEDAQSDEAGIQGVRRASGACEPEPEQPQSMRTEGPSWNR